MTMNETPRIALIHALEESVAPARAAFAEIWPEASYFDLLDTSLSIDRAQAGELDEAMKERFAALANYATAYSGKGGRTAGILFTCSAFGAAIDAVKAKVQVPVLRPNEAAFSTALRTGSQFLMLVSFEASLDALEAEFRMMADETGKPAQITMILVEGALAALQAGDGERHDRLLTEAAVYHAGSADTVILGQFSQARARSSIERSLPGTAVITTPHSAVAEMRRLVSHGSRQARTTIRKG